jgi:hypothetical protein
VPRPRRHDLERARDDGWAPCRNFASSLISMGSAECLVSAGIDVPKCSGSRRLSNTCRCHVARRVKPAEPAA